MVGYEGIVTSEGILKLPEMATLENERDDGGKYRRPLLRERGNGSDVAVVSEM